MRKYSIEEDLLEVHVQIRRICCGCSDLVDWFHCCFGRSKPPSAELHAQAPGTNRLNPRTLQMRKSEARQISAVMIPVLRGTHLKCDRSKRGSKNRKWQRLWTNESSFVKLC